MSEKYEKRIIDKSRNTEEWSEFLQSAWDHLDQQTQARLEGFGGGKKMEPVPQFISAPCEELTYVLAELQDKLKNQQKMGNLYR
mgnify:CR=1 FL=1